MELIIDLVMQFTFWTAKLWLRVKLVDLMRYGIGQAQKATIDDIEILHSSLNFIVVNKRYDVLINSDDRKVKVINFLLSFCIYLNDYVSGDSGASVAETLPLVG